jgi:FtsP/CotA-like multicopper oxidase with cupredoxin domain
LLIFFSKKNMASLIIIAVIYGSIPSTFLSINPSFAAPESGEGESTGVSDEGGNGVLRATITAAKQESKLEGQPITTMVYNGSLVGPTLRASPGDRVELTLVNLLDEPTNVHFHGLHVSPSGDADNVFREVSAGETAKYIIEIPANHPPGMFWYHSHQHGLSYKQVSNGLSGLIEIKGLVDLLPQSLHDIEQRTFAMRDFQIGSDPNVTSQRTVNGQINPEMSIAPGETQLWRLANVGSEAFYNIVLPGYVFHVVAEDGMPVWRVWEAEQLLLPSGKRYDVLVTGGAVGTYPLKALSYYQGCVVCPEAILATLNVEGAGMAPVAIPSDLLSRNDLENLTIDHQRTLLFSSDDEESHYMIDGKVFDHERVDQQVRLGDVEEWRLKNMDDDEHPFHIHINDFQVMSVNGQPYDAHGLQDTVVLPGHGEVVIRIPFEDFAGKFVYHCHIMFHGDGGMMGVVEVVE